MKYKTLQDMTNDVDKGIDVFWMNSGYKVRRDNKGKYYIEFEGNNNIVGLYHLDGVNSDYNSKDFYSLGYETTLNHECLV